MIPIHAGLHGNHFFYEILNKHAPIRQRRTKANLVPWITPAIKQLMRNRDYHKKKAIRFLNHQNHDLKIINSLG
jgi:hypothetical protein